MGRPVRVGALQTLLQCGLSPNEWVLKGRRVTGGHFLPVFILSFVHSYNSSSKIAFHLAKIYGNLGWNVKVEVSAA